MSNFVELQFNQKILKGGTAPTINPYFNTPVASGVAVINPSISTPVAINPSFNTPVGSYGLVDGFELTAIGRAIRIPGSAPDGEEVGDWDNLNYVPAIPIGISAINPSVIHIHRHSHANGAEPHSHEFHQ